MPQILRMHIGHSWDLEKKASGNQGYAAENGGKWDLRASQMVETFWEFRTSVIPGGKPAGPWNSQEK